MMDDLISRQRTIDVIKEFKHGATEWRDEQEEHSDLWHRADSAIASALEIGLRVKKIPSAQLWIPCSERLPEKSGKYIVSCKANAYSNITTTAQWQNRYKHWNMTGARSHWRVDAWMPLPSPYREEEHHDR